MTQQLILKNKETRLIDALVHRTAFIGGTERENDVNTATMAFAREYHPVLRQHSEGIAHRVGGDLLAHVDREQPMDLFGIQYEVKTKGGLLGYPKRISESSFNYWWNPEDAGVVVVCAYTPEAVRRIGFEGLKDIEADFGKKFPKAYSSPVIKSALRVSTHFRKAPK
ncbi:MAG: hypothetical protein HYS81_00405 [Candidatus Aenigmatarchaeota archaeon]|nr:MAG: hypothetical protein HYS81_00405 [Candidatus Aenigmarchaeota archaeon]